MGDVVQSDLEVLFAIMDSDGSGTVDLDEFASNMATMKSQEIHTQLIFIRYYATQIWNFLNRPPRMQGSRGVTKSMPLASEKAKELEVPKFCEPGKSVPGRALCQREECREFREHLGERLDVERLDAVAALLDAFRSRRTKNTGQVASQDAVAALLQAFVRHSELTSQLLDSMLEAQTQAAPARSDSWIRPQNGSPVGGDSLGHTGSSSWSSFLAVTDPMHVPPILVGPRDDQAGNFNLHHSAALQATEQPELLNLACCGLGHQPPGNSTTSKKHRDFGFKKV